MSRKEEELVEQEMESLKNENLDKEQLLEEVISDTADDAGNTAKPELKAMISDSEKAPEGKSQDMTEISGELTPEDAAVYKITTMSMRIPNRWRKIIMLSKKSRRK